MSPQSMAFFRRFRINSQFLKTDVEKWKLNQNYIDGVNIIKKLKVVNNLAERAI